MTRIRALAWVHGDQTALSARGDGDAFGKMGLWNVSKLTDVRTHNGHDKEWDLSGASRLMGTWDARIETKFH